MSGPILTSDGPLLDDDGLPYVCDDCPCGCPANLYVTVAGIEASICTGEYTQFSNSSEANSLTNIAADYELGLFFTFPNGRCRHNVTIDVGTQYGDIDVNGTPGIIYDQIVVAVDTLDGEIVFAEVGLISDSGPNASTYQRNTTGAYDAALSSDLSCGYMQVANGGTITVSLTAPPP